MKECERCGYQSEVEAEFSTVEAGLPDGFMTWDELWCSRCIALDDIEQKTTKKTKREVTFDGNNYKVRSDKIDIPDFSQMERTAVLLWMIHHTYGRSYSNKKPNPLQGFGGVISVKSN